MKRCGKCGAEGGPETFYVNRASKDGLTSYCRSCNKKSGAARRAAKPGYAVAQYRLKQYGIEHHEFASLVTRQAGLCAICELKMKPGHTCVDHDHLTGEVRGLLCRTCNIGIGHLRDSPTLITSALEYVS